MLHLKGKVDQHRKRAQELIDALPYVDGLSAQSRQQVDALIEEEARRVSKRPSDYLQEMGPGPSLKFDEHPLLTAEYERVKAKQPMKPLDTSRYRLDIPVASKQNDYGAWRSAADNAHAQLEHQYLRILNLELLLKYGDKTWRAQAQLSEAAQRQMEEDLHATKKRITELNQERKLSQMAAGAELRKLYEEYFQSVKKNLEIDNACERLQDEVDRMRTRLEAHEKQQQQQQQQEDGPQVLEQQENGAAAEQNGTKEQPQEKMQTEDEGTQGKHEHQAEQEEQSGERGSRSQNGSMETDLE